MLTVAPETLDDVRSVRIDVQSVVVRLALTYVAQEHGWTVCRNETGDGCVRIADTCTASSPVDVLVSRDTPSECQQAVEAVLNGAARAIVLWDEPKSLRTAIEALMARATVIPERVIELANTAPQLTDRHRQTLRLLAAGRSNSEISATLHQSSSTTKRDIAELLEIFDAANRASLTTAANRLGFV